MDQLRDVFLHDPGGAAELAMISNLLESRGFVIGSPDDFAVDFPLSASFAIGTNLITDAGETVIFQYSHMAELTNVGIVSDRFQLHFLLLHGVEMESVEGIHLTATFSTLAAGRLVDLMLEDQDENPSNPDGQPSGEARQTVFVGLFIQGFRERVSFRVFIGDTQSTPVLPDADPCQENQHGDQQNAAIVNVFRIPHSPAFDEKGYEKDGYG